MAISAVKWSKNANFYKIYDKFYDIFYAINFKTPSQGKKLICHLSRHFL
jgi:hypothetical protein